MKPELQESQFFHVVPPKNAGRKVAPGMSVVYTICFTPQENKVEFDGSDDDLIKIGKQKSQI